MVRLTKEIRGYEIPKYARYKVLRDLDFHGAPQWPLHWGGPEVKEACQ
jgi:hypothetical protein